MGRTKKNKRKRVRPEAAQFSLVPGGVLTPDGTVARLQDGPARALLAFPGDAEMLETMGAWPYYLSPTSELRGAATNLREVAAGSGLSVWAAAESVDRLQTDGFLVWDAEGNQYVLGGPAS